MLAPIGIIIIPKEDIKNSFEDNKLFNGSWELLDFGLMLGKNRTIRISASRLIETIQIIAM